MICPNCGFDNLPGSEECGSCLQDLTQLDRPTAHDRVERSLMEDRVEKLQPRAPIIISPRATLRQAIDLMLASGVGTVLLVDEGGQLVGILSERDVLTKVIGVHENWESLPVEPFMTPRPEFVGSRDNLAFALHKMDIGGYRHLPVVQDNKPVGVVSVRDMLRHITQLCKTT